MRDDAAHRRLGARALTLVCSAWTIAIWAWPPASLTLTVDDSYYYLRISEHIAAGLGPTFDGVERTSGFQPLWTGLLALLALLPLEPDAAMRLALSAGVVLLRAALALLERSEPGVELVGAAGLTSFWFAKVFVNGMESSLVAVLLAACLLAPRRAAWPWGLVGGLLILARLDTIFFVAPWLVSRPRVGWGVTAVLVPWAVLWLGLFGHLLPVSAAVKYDGVPLEAWIAAAIALGGGWLARDRAGNTWPLAAYALSVVIVGGWFEIWRLVPIALFAVVAVRRLSVRWRWVVLAAWVPLAVATWVIRLNPSSYAPYAAAQRTGIWLRDHTPPDAIVAGWDCGIVAAHSQRRFFQLEGLAGSWRFYELLRAGRTAEWIEMQQVDWIAQSISVDEPETVIDGVDLGRWRVARAECVEFRSIVTPTKIVRRMHLVLRRGGTGPTLADVLRADDPCRHPLE